MEKRGGIFYNIVSLLSLLEWQFAMFFGLLEKSNTLGKVF